MSINSSIFRNPAVTNSKEHFKKQEKVTLKIVSALNFFLASDIILEIRECPLYAIFRDSQKNNIIFYRKSKKEDVDNFNDF